MSSSSSTNSSYYSLSSSSSTNKSYYPDENENHFPISEQIPVLDASEKWNFFVRQINIEYVKEEKKHLENKTKRLQTAVKVLFVASKLLSILLPLVVAYCPFWVPWGIVFPIMLLLAFIHSRVNRAAEFHERVKQHGPLVKKILEKKSGNLKSFSPQGEWDLPSLDKRLKSDRMMQERAGKVHPESADSLINLHNNLNLESNCWLAQYSAWKLTGINDLENKWEKIKKKEVQAKKALHKGDLARYLKLHKEIYQYRLNREGEITEHVLPPTSERSKLQHVISRHAACTYLIHKTENSLNKLNALYEQSGLDYSVYSAFEDYKKIHQQHFEMDELAQRLQEKIELIISLLIDEPEGSEFCYYKALIYAEENQLEFACIHLIDTLHLLESNVQEVIKQHPYARIQGFRNKMIELNEGILDKKSLKLLARWIEKDIDNKNLKFTTLPGETRDFWQRRDFPVEVRDWLQKPQNKEALKRSPVQLLNDIKRKDKKKRTYKLLKTWVSNHPTLSQQSCRRILQEMQLAQKFMQWLDKNESMHFKNFVDILEDSLTLHTSFKAEYAAFEELVNGEQQPFAEWVQADIKKKNTLFRTLPRDTRNFWKKRDFPQEVYNWLSGPENKEALQLSPAELLDLDDEKLRFPLLNEWVNKYPNLSQKSCQEVLEEMRFAEHFMPWLEKYDSIPSSNFFEILDYSIELSSLKVPDALQLRSSSSSKVKAEDTESEESEESRSFNNEENALPEQLENYTKLCNNLDSFEKNNLSKLWKLYKKEGAGFSAKRFFQKMFSSSTLPFDKALHKGSPLQAHKFQEYHLNELLKKCDGRTLWIARLNFTGIPVMTYSIVIVQAIFSYYGMSHWVFWGFSAFNTMVGSSAYYLNHLLKKEDRKKQAIKLQSFLKDRPGIGRFPGTCSHLKHLNRLDKELGIDGMERTAAVAIMEGNKAIPIPKNVASAKKMIKKYAKEGSKKAQRYLENRLVTLKSQYSEYQSVEGIQEGIQIAKAVDSLKEELASYERHEMLEREIEVLKSQYAYQVEMQDEEKAEALKERYKILVPKFQEEQKEIRDKDKIEEELNAQKKLYSALSKAVRKGIKIALLIEDIEQNLSRKPNPPPVVTKSEEMKRVIKEKKEQAELDAIQDQIWIERIKESDYEKLLNEYEQLEQRLPKLYEREQRLQSKLESIQHILDPDELLEIDALLTDVKKLKTAREQLDKKYDQISEENIDIIKAEYDTSVRQDYYLYYQYQIYLSRSKRLHKEHRLRQILEDEKSRTHIEGVIEGIRNKIEALQSRKEALA